MYNNIVVTYERKFNALRKVWRENVHFFVILLNGKCTFYKSKSLTYSICRLEFVDDNDITGNRVENL